MNGTLFFIASDGKQGYELWMADVPSNTPVVHEPSVDPPIVDLPSVDQPTVSVPEISFLPPALVMDLIDGNGSSNPTSLTNVNGTLFFSTNDGTNGSELWKTDGTLAGTALVKDILSGSSGSTPSSLANVNGTLFFSASDGANGEELWKSDGTLAGTALVKDILSGIGSSNLDSLTNMNGTLFFTANDGTNGSELWRSDGTSAGTTLVKDIRSGSGSSTPRYLTNVNGTLYFSASDGADGSELWKSDGTSAGTTLVKDILSGSGSSLPRYLTNVNGMLFFRASNGVSGDELWQSDGTSAGTQLVRDIVSGIGTSNPRSLINANGTLYFSASNGVNGDELWQSDGTSTGTKLVRDIRSGSSGSSPSSLMNVNGMLFFSASNGVNGTELWQSDGTSAGTKLVRDIRNGGSGSSPSYLTNVNGALYFTANDGRNGVELWSMRLNERPRLTTFAAAVDIVDITADETEVELTFDELSVQGDESDADGTVVAFIVQSVSTGTLKIGTSAATAAPFAAGANDRIDATLKAYWMPVANVSGYVSAFSVAAEDDIRQPSVLPVTVTVTVTRTKPEILPPEPSYTSLQPIIRWFGVIGANSYEVWVKNLSTGASPFLTAILDRTATVTVDSFIPGVDLGIGTFRVWVRAKSGNVFSAWSLGRDFVITTAPTLNAIAPLQTTFRPTFRWSPLAGATRYEVWINNRTTGTSAVVRDSNVTATSFTVPSNLPVGNYRVWVRGISSDNAAADWSPPADFGIGVAPTITQGQNASFVRVPEIRWSVLPGATRYDVWIDNLSTGTSQIVRNTNVNSTTYTGPNNLPIGNYRAMVRGIAADGFVTAWTPAVNFKIDGAPTRIAGPSSTFDNKPTFAWNAVIGATKYEIFIRNVATGATTINQSGITTTQFTPGTALADGTHRWWVRAETAQGFQSLWSSGADIIIGGRTALLTPTGRTSDTTPTFTWQNVQGVLRYDLSVDRVGGQSQIIRQQSLTSATYTPATPLAKGTYRVWIRAISTTGRISVWSTPVDITIADNSLSPNGRHQLPGSIDAAESLLSPAYSEQTSVDSRHDETASEWAWFENHRVSATFDETDRSPKTAASDAAITPFQSNSDLSPSSQPEENDETAVDALMSEAGSMNFLPGI
ncbi:MAG: ELWxxDGT repeat protein [Planctomyces sp.]